MQLPEVPKPQRIPAISPSIYEAAKACKAKAVWARFGNTQHTIDTPNALIGTAFHKVMELAGSGKLPEGDAGRIAARHAFDDEAQRMFQRTHPLLRAKYPSTTHLPNYFLQRERALTVALTFVPTAAHTLSSPRAQGAAHSTQAAEQTLTSADGKLKGKIDWLNTAEHEIVDYKTGVSFEGQRDQVSDRERRQLSLYAYLARQHGAVVQKGTIIRSNGRRCSIAISMEQADSLANEARGILDDYNLAVANGADFDELGQPSKEACWFCPCIPFCTQFWQANKNGWPEYQGFGWHIQGTVSQISSADIQGLQVVTIILTNCLGTDIPPNGTVTLQQVPTTWISPDPVDMPKSGDVIRIVHARKAHPARNDVFRADKALSTVWHVSP